MESTLHRKRMDDSIFLHQIESGASFFRVLTLFIRLLAEVAMLDVEKWGIDGDDFGKQLCLCLIDNIVKSIPINKEILERCMAMQIKIKIYSFAYFLNILFDRPNARSILLE